MSKSISVRFVGKVALNHERNLECYSVLEFAQVKTRDLLDLIKSVNESVSVNEHFSGCFGNVEVVFEEALDREKRFAVERIERALLENFVEEHFAKRCGKLVYKSAYAEVFVADNILIRIENSA